MHTVFALLCFVVAIHWLIFPYPPGLLRWHCGNLTIAPVPAKQPWWIWINTSCEIIMNEYITTTKQSTTKPCAYLLGYTVFQILMIYWIISRVTHTVHCFILLFLEIKTGLAKYFLPLKPNYAAISFIEIWRQRFQFNFNSILLPFKTYTQQ